MSTEDVIELALQLKPEERLQVLEKIQQSFDQADPEIDRLWRTEVLRRLAAHRSGQDPGIPAEEVLGRL
jgi:putative addiction module component (TIGR02574 family)